MSDYYVIGDSGDEPEGPVDLDTLRRWSQEGRIVPETRLKNAESGAVVFAGRLYGMEFARDASIRSWGYQDPFVNSPYPRDLTQPVSDSAKEVKLAWACIAIGTICCPCFFMFPPIFYGIAIHRTILARTDKDDPGLTARLIAIYGLILWVGSVGFFGFMG